MDAALKIYTDGGCSGNPGPGGWAYVMVLNTFQGERVIAENKGGEKDTTNNRMEISAVIMALRALKKMNNTEAAVPNSATVLTDSQYVQKGISEWIHTWKRNNWRTADKTPVKNQDLWQELDSLAGEFNLKWEWVKGHAGNLYNERCDQLTQNAIASIR